MCNSSLTIVTTHGRPAKLWISPHIAGVYIITDIQYPDFGRLVSVVCLSKIKNTMVNLQEMRYSVTYLQGKKKISISLANFIIFFGYV